MKISQMIKQLQDIKEEHGDLDLYEYSDIATIIKRENAYLPRVDKIHYKKHADYPSLKDELHNEDLSVSDENIYDIDLSRPIVKGVVI
ncbi:hypothetical protein BCBBV1cgp9 [Bacillus phage BCASJ1c]|uniref:9 protein n=1 Tax=Bacillus phage BCASJ1c TaxID=294382 RepID=Q5YAA1_9CAUD|nr:hypothetical protein BCBBV1cgp9 [Bacillus phage BCASJ1c]AAU85056.1 9 [Bacillus phage BCASJ1c] [Bacillus phage BCASJ1c]